MQNRALVSVGLFGRLSCLTADRTTVLEAIEMGNDLARRWREDAGNLTTLVNTGVGASSAPVAAFATALPTLLRELNALVEAIVLSDELLVFCGYSPEVVDQTARAGYRNNPGGHAGGFYQTIVWSAEANQLQERAFASVPIKLVTLDDERMYEAEIALDYPQRAMVAWPMAASISTKGIDFRTLTSIDAEDASDEYGSENDKKAMAEILAFVDSRLGEEWLLYKSELRPLPSWPIGLLTVPTGSVCAAARAVSLQLGFFAEMRTALRYGTLSCSPVHMGTFQQMLSTQNNVVSAPLRALVSQRYSKHLMEKLEAFGIMSLELQLPPLLRMCLLGARSIDDVLANANKLRKQRRFKNLRGYLGDLSAETNPLKLLRKLERLQRWIEMDIRGLGANLVNGTLTLGGAATISLSLITLAQQLLAWRNPVVMVHSRLVSMLSGEDSVMDLARVFQVDRLAAAQAITRYAE
jgi:hypothetical protein